MTLTRPVSSEIFEPAAEPKFFTGRNIFYPAIQWKAPGYQLRFAGKTGYFLIDNFPIKKETLVM
jgi:hypothetical protein